MATTITPVSLPGSASGSGPVNTLPLPTSIINNAAVAPVIFLELATLPSGQTIFTVNFPLHKNTRTNDIIRVDLKSSATPPVNFRFIIECVDSFFLDRYVIQGNGVYSTSYNIENIKNMGITNGLYKLSYSQITASGTLSVASLSSNHLITV